MTNSLIRLEKRDGQTHLVLDIPLEHDAEITKSVSALLEMSNDPATRDRLLGVLITSAEQSYFWTPEWQAGEKQADKEHAEGDYKTFDSIDDMMSFLDNQE